MARRGAVAAGHPAEVAAALDVLEAGGNAVDACVAGAFAAFVVEPNNAGLTGYGHLTAWSPERGSFGGITLAINVERPEDVDAAIAAAVEAGGSVLKPGTDAVFGRSGYFADPDGYPWEVAYNPEFPIGDDGRLTIP